MQKENMIPHIAKTYKAFRTEDERLNVLVDPNVGGHPFINCTNGARWLKENFYPEGKIIGYHWADNQAAEVGKFCGGHDFIIVENRYLIDFWYRYTTRENPKAPIALDLHNDQQLIRKYYGDPSKWEELPEHPYSNYGLE